MKVVEQLIRFFMSRGELTHGQLEALAAKGFIKQRMVQEAQAEQEVEEAKEEPKVVEEPLETRQERLEGIGGRKGKKPFTGEVKASVKRLMRARMAAKRHLVQ